MTRVRGWAPRHLVELDLDDPDPDPDELMVLDDVAAAARVVYVGEPNHRIHPIAVGYGQRLFEDTPTYPLQLVRQETYATGVLSLAYARGRVIRVPRARVAGVKGKRHCGFLAAYSFRRGSRIGTSSSAGGA